MVTCDIVQYNLSLIHTTYIFLEFYKYVSLHNLLHYSCFLQPLQQE